MLRFDVPKVWSNVARWEALVTFALLLVALTVTPWAMALLVLQGGVRGFLGHHRSPSHRLWTSVAEGRGWGGKKEDAGAKMFASKLLFVASGAALVLFLVDSALWRVPCVVLLGFSFLEWALSFCAACWVYALWLRPRGAARPR